MAGDWIKMRTNLARSPQVVRIASALKADRLRVVGGLHALWSLFDEQTEDGFLPGYTAQFVDEMIGWSGFCAVLQSVEWLVIADDGIYVPRFEEHNGKSAKRRAQEADRKRVGRVSATTSALDADKKQTREEKRRVVNPLPPCGGFEAFWSAWPKSERKQAKGKCLQVWLKREFEKNADAICSHVRAMTVSEGWKKDGGQFVPAPLVYLNQARWEGAEVVSIPTRQSPAW
jgi:hypothetical protein